MTTRILVLAMGQLSNGEMTIAHSCLSDLDPALFDVLFVSHAKGADYLTKLGATAAPLDGCDAVRHRAAVRHLVDQFRPDLLLCADVYTLDYGSTWSGVDFSWLRTLGLPLATFDEYDWEDGDFTWDTAGSASRVNPDLVRGCDLVIRPCPLSDPDKPRSSPRPPTEVVHCRLIPRRVYLSVSREAWRAALDLQDGRPVVFTVNSSWEYVNVSPKPEVARLIEWMPRISAELFAHLSEPVTVVHVGPRPWRPDTASPLDYRHFASLPPDLYRATIGYANLFYGTNATSITLSNAVAAGTPSVLLHNPRPIDFRRLSDVLPRMPRWYREMAADVPRRSVTANGRTSTVWTSCPHWATRSTARYRAWGYAHDRLPGDRTFPHLAVRYQPSQDGSYRRTDRVRLGGWLLPGRLGGTPLHRCAVRSLGRQRRPR